MISSEVDPDPALRPEPEVLAFGPALPTPRLRRSGLLLLAVLVALVAALGLWWVLPKPAPDFTLGDLEGGYTGMVRSDGTNDVSTLTRDKLTGSRVAVTPLECAPLFDATLSNQFPSTALDGVSTYWLNEGSASISLVTFRYPDAKTARAQFDQIQTAFDACAGVPMRVDRSNDVVAVPQQVAPPEGVQRYLSYLVSSPPATTRFTTDVAQLDNVVTWQYRYDYSSTSSYSPVAAQQLMTSLTSQLRYIQDSHRKPNDLFGN